MRKLSERAADLDKLPGFSDVRLTSVFGGYILSGSPFVETPKAMVLTFLTEAVKRFGSRWVFTLKLAQRDQQFAFASFTLWWF